MRRGSRSCASPLRRPPPTNSGGTSPATRRKARGLQPRPGGSKALPPGVRGAFGAPRYRVLYRAWLREGASIVDATCSPVLADAISRGTGRARDAGPGASVSPSLLPGWHVMSRRAGGTNGGTGDWEAIVPPGPDVRRVESVDGAARYFETASASKVALTQRVAAHHRACWSRERGGVFCRPKAGRQHRSRWESGRERPPSRRATRSSARSGGSLTPRLRVHMSANILAQLADRPMARSCCPIGDAGRANAVSSRPPASDFAIRKETVHVTDQASHPRQAARPAPHASRSRDQRDALRVRAILGEPTEYVLNQVIDTVLAKDKDFQQWRATHPESFVPRNATAEAVSVPAERRQASSASAAGGAADRREWSRRMTVLSEVPDAPQPR